MRERTGRREGSCGGGTSRADGVARELYISGTLKAVLDSTKDSRSVRHYNGGTPSWRQSDCGQTAVRISRLCHGSYICLEFDSMWIMLCVAWTLHL